MKRGLWLTLLLVSCAGGIERHLHTPKEPLTFSAVVVYPPQLSGEEAPAWRTYELGERLVATAVDGAGQRVAFFGPTEVRVLRWSDDAAWVASDAVPLLIRSGIRPDQALVLRTTAEKRVASQHHEAQDARGRRRASVATEEVTWVARVELLHPSSGQLVAEVAGQVTVDPFAPLTGEEEFDAAPTMTHLLERLLLEGLSLVRPFEAGHPPAPPLKVAFAQTPAGTAALPDPTVAALDALGAQLWVENRARFLTPALPERVLGAVARARPGLWVLDAPTDGSLQPGDVVIEIDGAPPLRQVLARKRLTVTPVPVRIQRGALETDAWVP